MCCPVTFDLPLNSQHLVRIAVLVAILVRLAIRIAVQSWPKLRLDFQDSKGTWFSDVFTHFERASWVQISYPHSLWVIVV
jgi:hypothetical protein